MYWLEYIELDLQSKAGRRLTHTYALFGYKIVTWVRCLVPNEICRFLVVAVCFDLFDEWLNRDPEQICGLDPTKITQAICPKRKVGEINDNHETDKTEHAKSFVVFIFVSLSQKWNEINLRKKLIFFRFGETIRFSRKD